MPLPTSDHRTAVFTVPLTLAVNCCLPLGETLADDGAICMPTGGTFTEALAVFVVSACDWARITSDSCRLGALKSPVEDTVPLPEVTVQFTAVFVVPVTAALNC